MTPTPTGPAQEPSDTEMLDWIERHECAFGWPQPECPEYWIFSDDDKDVSGKTLREAIKAAIINQRPPATAQGEKL